MKIINNERIELAKEAIEDMHGCVNKDCDFKDPHKPYYAICSWQNGFNGSFCTKEELLNLFNDMCKRSSDESYTTDVFDIDQNCFVEFTITKIEISKSP